MILAVRIHPEHPASTVGTEDPVLLSEATGHSNYQAEVHVLGIKAGARDSSELSANSWGAARPAHRWK